MKDLFPTLSDPTLAYFDSAASTQTHTSVIKRIDRFYNEQRCNIHRGDFPLSQEVTDDCESARDSVAKLINADPEHIIFTHGTTESLNMVADWHKDTEVVIITELEHSANILPWLAQGRTVDNGRLIVLPANDVGVVDYWEHEHILEKNPGALLSIIGTSNVTGKTNDLFSFVNVAHHYGLTVCIDAAQTISSHKIDVHEIDADYIAFGAHKMFGPTGIGALYTKRPPDDYPCVRHGGGTIVAYDFNGNMEYYTGPMKHEPGTPNIAGILGFGVAAEWINYIGYEEICDRIETVHDYLTYAGLFKIDGLELVYPSRYETRNVFSFRCTKHHPSDISTLLGFDNVAVRVGKVCSHPIVNKNSDNGILRVSTHIYNTKEDCEKLVESLCNAMKKLG
jgi:cysteine desulfurase/selenocysteine lyase